MVRQAEIAETQFDYEKSNKKTHLYADKKLFVASNKSCGSKKQLTLAKTSMIPPQRREILYQFGACSYLYMIEFYAKKSAEMDDVRLVALIDCEPRQREPEGKWNRLMGTRCEEDRDSAKG